MRNFGGLIGTTKGIIGSGLAEGILYSQLYPLQTKAAIYYAV